MARFSETLLLAAIRIGLAVIIWTGCLSVPVSAYYLTAEWRAVSIAKAEHAAEMVKAGKQSQ